MEAGGVPGRGTNASAAHASDAAARAMRARVVEVGCDESTRRFAAVDAREEKSSGGFEYGERGSLQKIGETDKMKVFAAADGEDEAGIGVKVYAEARRAALAPETRENALEESGAAGDGFVDLWHVASSQK